MFDTTKYFARSLDSYHPSESTFAELTPPDNPVTYEMVHDLKCDEALENVLDSASSPATEITNSKTDLDEASELDTHQEEKSEDLPEYGPQMMIIYETGDINSALHFLIESVHNPFAPNAFAIVLVEEKIQEEVIQRISTKLRPLNESVAEHPNFLASKEKCAELNLRTIVANNTEVAPPLVSPVFVYDVTHEMLGSAPTGVITFHTFVSNQAAIEIYQKESLPIRSISTWNESMDGSYDIITGHTCPHYFINCANVSLHPIYKKFLAKENYVTCENCFHYETLNIYNNFKCIVFPIGSAIPQNADNDEKEPDPITFLEA
ncbi:hypothetical protein KR009_009404 [Drosophila setifemur]|nr:hypothetical protein KR009_009404 [Drosophila setifemur]